VFLSRRGQRVAAVIDADDLERLIELAEDMTEICAAEEWREEAKPRSTSSRPIHDREKRFRQSDTAANGECERGTTGSATTFKMII